MNICILGAGAWGTAMAIHLVRLGHTVTLAPRRFEFALELGARRENRDYLAGFPFPESLQIGYELTPLLMEAELLVLGCPTAGVADWCERVRDHLGLAQQVRLVLSLAKGIDTETGQTPCQIARRILPEGIAVGALTGPSHAAEVADGRPTALLLATERHDDFATDVQAAMSGPAMRIYTSDDLTGAELGGALKNIYAIAAGMSDGLRLGDNAKAALVTRVLAEMLRIGEALGARPITFAGLSGFGDLVATCYGAWSRNHDFGQRLGEGHGIDELLRGRRTVVEGYRTTQALHNVCAARSIEAPILEQVHAILYRGRKPADGLAALMTRGLKAEQTSSR